MATFRGRLSSIFRGFRRPRSPSNEPSEDQHNKHRKLLLPNLNILVEKVKRTKKTEEIDIPIEDITFLREIGVLKDLKHSFPNVRVSEDKKGGKICLKLKGHGEEFSLAYEQYRSLQYRINRNVYNITDPTIWNLMADSRGKEHVKAMLSWRNIKAQVC